MKLFQSKKPHHPQLGDTYIRSKFAWLPVPMCGYWIWLEKYSVEYYYRKDIDFLGLPYNRWIRNRRIPKENK